MKVKFDLKIKVKFDLKTFKPNLLKDLWEAYQAEFETGKNVLGVSSLPFGERSTVISKREGLSLPFKNELLAGEIFHYAWQNPKAIRNYTKTINEALGLTEKVIQKKRYIRKPNGKYIRFWALNEDQWKWKFPGREYIRIYEGQYLRQHPDIATSLYPIELKSTAMPQWKWGEVAVYHLVQLNTYCGLNGWDFGFLLRCDLGTFSDKGGSKGGFMKSRSKRFSFLWNNYFHFFPHEFNSELFEYSITKAKRIFNYLTDKTELEKISCPKFVFECKDECRKWCPNPIDKVNVDTTEKCAHCGKAIISGTKALIRNDQTYHYTNEKGHEYQDCVKACKKDWRREGL